MDEPPAGPWGPALLGGRAALRGVLPVPSSHCPTLGPLFSRWADVRRARQASAPAQASLREALGPDGSAVTASSALCSSRAVFLTLLAPHRVSLITCALPSAPTALSASRGANSATVAPSHPKGARNILGARSSSDVRRCSEDE